MAEVTTYLKEQLMGLGEKPDRGTLRQRLTQALKDLPTHLRPDRETPSDKEDDSSAEDNQ